MENKTGTCRFCGQSKIIEVPAGYTESEVNEEVTLECKCAEAKEYQAKKEEEETIEMSKTSAKGTTFELFHSDFPEVEATLNSVIDHLVSKKMKKVTISTGTKVTGTISISKGTIKVERIEKSTYTRETELS